MINIGAIRKEYKLETLDETITHNDPLDQFEKWWQQAIESNIDEVNAMTLSTVDENHKPSSRIVLLKEFGAGGFIFYSNYESHKAEDIKHNPNVSVVFFWKELERQVRIEGVADKSDTEKSDVYFNSRPENSKIGAWASPQSKVIANREVIEKNQAGYLTKFAGAPVPRPPHWGGYTIIPNMIEFWQGRPSRLHDRIRYLRINDKWIKERLAP